MKKKYITTSIAYVNAPPHIGFLNELLVADVLKRYHKSKGEEVFLLTGTDEHGIKVAQAAADAGKEPQVFVDEVAQKFEQLGRDFNLDFDYFIRTTNQEHIKFVQEKWRQLAEAGVLEKKKYIGLYCSGCEAFKSEGEIENGQCAIHEKKLEEVEEENWFLTGIKNQESRIKKWINEAVFPESRRREVTNVLESGAYDEVSVSRPKAKNSWGVPVPDDDSQVMYVWVDALFNYISALKIKFGESASRRIWPADIQIIGKDILKFHAIIWPALLLACGYELPKKLLVHGFINVDGKKMSKSLGNVIAPQELLERYGAQASRYLLCRGLSFDDDSNFTWADFDRLYNGELANGLGNLLARLVGIGHKVTKFALPTVLTTISTTDPFDIKQSLGAVNDLINKADGIITAEKLWENSNDKHEKFVVAVSYLLKAAALLAPFMPETAVEIRRQLTKLDSKPLFPRFQRENQESRIWN